MAEQPVKTAAATATPPTLAEAQAARGLNRTAPVAIAEQSAAEAAPTAPATAPISPAPVRERPLYILGPERMKEAEYARSIYVANPGEGVTLADLLRPECWAAVSGRLLPWSHIEVRAEDGTYYAELLVKDVGRAWANVDVLVYKELTTKDVSMTQAVEIRYEIKHTPSLQWHVIRKVDRHVIKDNFQMRSQAEDALREHLKTVPG